MEEEYFETDEKSKSSNLKAEVSSEEHIYENIMEDVSDLLMFDHNVAMEYCGGDEEIFKQIHLEIKRGRRFVCFHRAYLTG